MGHMKIIYESLINRKDKICHKSEIVGIVKEYKIMFKSKVKVIDVIKYLSRHKYIKRIFQGYYYINSANERESKFCDYEDRELFFIILNKLKIKWYVGLNSALYLLGKIWTYPRTLHILNNRFSGMRKILSLKVIFFKIKDSLFFTLKNSKTKHEVKFYYSNLTKTKLDMLYLNKIDKLEKSNQTKKYLKYYPKWLGKKLI